MRNVIVIFIALSSYVPECLAYEVGEVVVPVRDIEVKVDSKVVSTVPTGWGLHVLKAKGDRLWVSAGNSGWIKTADVIPLADAVEYFTKAIAKKSDDSRLYQARGNVWMAKLDFDKAIHDYDNAIKLSPSEAGLYCCRAMCYDGKKDYKRSVLDYSEAIRLQPDCPNYNCRGFCYLLAGEFGKAVEDLEAAIELDQTFLLPVSNLAYIRACCPDAQYRDGEKAVALAKKACEGDKYLDPENVHILACAYAEAGDYVKAVRWEKKAIEMNPAQKTTARTAYDRALNQFKQDEPFHEMSSLE